MNYEEIEAELDALLPTLQAQTQRLNSATQRELPKVRQETHRIAEATYQRVRELTDPHEAIYG